MVFLVFLGLLGELGTLWRLENLSTTLSPSSFFLSRFSAFRFQLSAAHSPFVGFWAKHLAPFGSLFWQHTCVLWCRLAPQTTSLIGQDSCKASCRWFCFLLHIVMLRLHSQSLPCGNSISTRALFVPDDGVMACCLAYKFTVFVAWRQGNMTEMAPMFCRNKWKSLYLQRTTAVYWGVFCSYGRLHMACKCRSKRACRSQ